MRHLLKSLVRQAGYEVSRLPRVVKRKSSGEIEFYKTALGDVYLPTSAPHDSIVYQMRRGLVFEPEIVETGKRFIRPGTAVLDVGSNFGQMAMLFSREVGPTGCVYAFEAQRQVYDILCKNLDANELTNIKAIFGAVFDEADRVFHFPEPDFKRFAAFGSYNLPLREKTGPEVKSVRIDDLDISEPISFMKVDVQGCDLFAMRGAVETIKKNKMPILFEFEQRFQDEYGTTFQDYVDFTDLIGYRFQETILDINFLITPR